MLKSLIMIVSLGLMTQVVQAEVVTVPLSQPLPAAEKQAWFPPLAVSAHSASQAGLDSSAAALLGVGVYQSEMTALWSQLDDVGAELAPIPAGPKVAHVTEPATLGLLGLGLAAIALVRNRRHRNVS